MISHGTAAEAEAALGRAMTWAEAAWFRYSAATPDFVLTWHVSLVFAVSAALWPLPLLLLKRLAQAVALRYKVQPRVKHSPGAVLRNLRDTARILLPVVVPFQLIYSATFKVVGFQTGLPLPSVRDIAAQLLVFSLLEDYLSYWAHRFLHTMWAYDKIHYVHHEIRSPTAFGAGYAHAAELMIYVTTTFIGPAIVLPHRNTLAMVLDPPNGEHGLAYYSFPFSPTKLIPFYGGAELHDYHHYVGKSRCNFASVFTYCDYIYGTHKSYMFHKDKPNKVQN